jgi:hypothetical protein
MPKKTPIPIDVTVAAPVAAVTVSGTNYMNVSVTVSAVGGLSVEMRMVA